MKLLVAVGAPVILLFIAIPGLAKNIVQSKITGPYRIELALLPPEPFYSPKEVAAGKIKSGMLTLGGAEPVKPDAPSHPNHHLVVHVFEKTTNKVVTNATVRLTAQRLDSDGQPAGKAQKVPVVRMEMIGGGPEMTHYGNNVSLSPGDYRVEAIANGHRASFTIKVATE
ncbi:MAG: hypothetical protein ABSD31_05465 [Candidatus Binataceae bacterium]|jgi:hypothetical protein